MESPVGQVAMAEVTRAVLYQTATGQTYIIWSSVLMTCVLLSSFLWFQLFFL